MNKYTKPLKKDMTDGTATIKAGTEVYFKGYLRPKEGEAIIRCHVDEQNSVIVPGDLKWEEHIDMEKIPEWLEKSLKK